MNDSIPIDFHLMILERQRRRMRIEYKLELGAIKKELEKYYVAPGHVDVILGRFEKLPVADKEAAGDMVIDILLDAVVRFGGEYGVRVKERFEQARADRYIL